MVSGNLVSAIPRVHHPEASARLRAADLLLKWAFRMADTHARNDLTC